MKNLSSLMRPGQVDPTRDDLLVVGNSDDQPIRVFRRRGDDRSFYRFGGNPARFRMTVVTGTQIMTGRNALGMRMQVFRGREAGLFDRGCCMQMQIMSIMSVRQEGCATERCQNQDWDKHHREDATGQQRPKNSVTERAASGGWAPRHRYESMGLNAGRP